MKVSIDHQKKKGSVEELHNKDSIGDEAGLLGLGVIANIGYQLDDDGTKGEVDDDYSELYNLVIDNDTLQVSKVFVTDGWVEFQLCLSLSRFESLWSIIIGKTECLIETV